ncbi:MAG: hypothetical protein COA32_11555 [Fluviicola sp.]|nr:MAG: hypothetical protein COA32_11555 [Fluviicola sp.]
MKIILDQSEYWDSVANEKTFNHLIDWDFLQKHIESTSKILDFGCGYGRLSNEFYHNGFHNIIGVDNSKRMIDRAKQLNSQVNFMHLSLPSLPFENNTFDLICLFAVLTCVPIEQDQQTLISELKRVLRPNGILYVSDLLLNEDERNLKRYNAYGSGPYGVFELPEGGVFRHHSEEYLENQLMSFFNILYRRSFTIETMNKNQSKAIQLVGEQISNK